ncbi:MAG TPA: hypothetical protein VKU94_07110 [Geobacterales bacterium]|nr:hypothetical protein [Geobacterales bacterium]
MERAIEKLFTLRAKSVAVGYDDSEYCYPAKNKIVSDLLAYGIDVKDCGTTVASALSACVKDMEANAALFIYKGEKDLEYLIFDSSGFPIFTEEQAITKEVKKWNEIGSIEQYDVNRIYIKKLSKMIEVKKRFSHIIFNANYSPIASYVSKILLSFAERFTTLNANETRTMDMSFEESLNVAKVLAKSYNADLVLSIDRLYERLVISSSNMQNEDIMKRLITGIEKKTPSKIYILGDLGAGIKGFQKIDSLKEVSLNGDCVVIDTKRSTIIYSPISGWFDPLITFILWYKSIFI